MDSVTLTLEKYQDLIDARNHDVAMRDVAAGAMPVLTEAEMAAYLASASSLAFWRRQRGNSQTRLAKAVGISQPYLAQIKAGKRVGDVNLYSRLAKALHVRIEDLVAE